MRINKGVALITAMMVLALASITAVSMTADQRVYFRRTQNILLHEQGYMYLLSAEDFTKVGLAEDYKDNQTDSYADAWYSEEPVIFPVEGGTLSGKLTDMQGRININNLAKTPRDPWDEERLRQALRNNDIPQDVASMIFDWLDENQDPSPGGGAEDIDYLSGDQPYRVGDGMLGSITELKLLKGMDEEKFTALKEIFVALPATDVTINLNTAPAAVLRVIIPELSDTSAEELAKDLAENPLKEPGDIFDHPIVRGTKIEANGLGTESSYFLLESMAVVDRAISKMHSVLYRQDDKNIDVVLRTQGGL